MPNYTWYYSELDEVRFSLLPMFASTYRILYSKYFQASTFHLLLDQFLIAINFLLLISKHVSNSIWYLLRFVLFIACRYRVHSKCLNLVSRYCVATKVSPYAYLLYQYHSIFSKYFNIYLFNIYILTLQHFMQTFPSISM